MPAYPLKLIAKLAETARQLRVQSLKLIHQRQAGFPGGCLSCAEIIAVLFFHTLNLDPKNPEWEERDQFILSKSHASAILYAAMAWRGFYKFSELDHWGDFESQLRGRPNRTATPGVEMTVGLPGHGLSVAVGLALSAKLKKSTRRVFTLLGDGECQSGLVWEGAEVAAKHHLSNLVAIIDKNRVQADGMLKEVMPLDPLADKWRAFNWHVLEIDGHSTGELMEAFDVSKNINDDPVVIIAHTTKGKGVAFMENNPLWHSKIPDDQQLALALHDLDRGQIK